MGALASLAAVAGAGASIYGTVRQSQTQAANNRAQVTVAQQQETARQQELAAQQEAERAQRAQTLARTIASTRAKLAASGIAPDEGSAGAVTTGLRRTAAESQQDDDEVFRARLARGRSSLLNPDGTLTAVLQSGRTLGAAARNLLD
jgi:hypothetical protein